MFVLMLALGLAQVEAPDQVVTADRMVCKQEHVTTGTRFKPPPVCKTQSEWEDEARAMRKQLQKINDRSINPTPIPGANKPPEG